MSDDIVKRLRNTPNWMREEYAHYKDGLKVYDRAPFEAAYALEAQAAEITRLRAELATARREGMEEAAQIGDRHVEIGEVLSETEADKRLADNIKMQVGAMKQVVGAIRAAAKEVKP